jgi:hypothetical protein
MTLSTLGLGVLGLLLHIALGVVTGRVLAYMVRKQRAGHNSAGQWLAYALLVALMIAYARAVDHMTRAMEGSDLYIGSLAAVMLAVCGWTYFRKVK